MRLRLSRIHHPVTALGPGRRIGIWTQGCTIACPGCVSRDTWPADQETEVAVAAVLDWCGTVDPAGVAGVTISGGEPSEQPAALSELVAGLAGFQREYGWDLLCYTGVEENEFADRCPEVYRSLDALVTGPYRAGEPTDLVWRGSANQRLIPLSELGHSRYDEWVSAETSAPAIQVQVADERIWLIGVPGRSAMSKVERMLADRGIRLEGVSWRP
ncbi:anaerobic ribonucleoside-triphosphate reductase activating protein [Kibdelosporangium banguiense]|uniref:Anaerobic ribonucleoside-triphosphate reductase activating protein n=1 Tax=Kibdelosporangium banguiense TaxID=1365924 RepID=A0ABS4TUC8_9PSEU|nr:4Fe-4S single cluster domain-containing protein [Kibdelosporangium banguiense]MBP2328005.1 anaerobic ribonucleoside-triphosphate reductase activating protein [Kibdelosporangium banguiense]